MVHKIGTPPKGKVHLDTIIVPNGIKVEKWLCLECRETFFGDSKEHTCMINTEVKKEVSRIDVIGQNGNDGLHYKEVEDTEFLAKLINDHWKYVEGVLTKSDREGWFGEIEFHYKSAFAHGWKHAKEYYGIN